VTVLLSVCFIFSLFSAYPLQADGPDSKKALLRRRKAFL